MIFELILMMREEREKVRRSIGDSVPPPRKKGKNSCKIHYSRISRKHVINRFLKRIFIMMPLFIVIFEVMTIIFFSPFIIIGLTSDPPNFSAFFILLLPVVILIPIFFITIPLSFIIVNKRIVSAVKDNNIKITKKNLIINLKVSKMVSPRKLIIPLDSIKEVVPADDEYLKERKKETSLWYKILNYEYKPRYGDYFNVMSEAEDLFILKLSKPIFVPYFDHFWTATENINKGKEVDEIVVNIDHETISEFREDIGN